MRSRHGIWYAASRFCKIHVWRWSSVDIWEKVQTGSFDDNPQHVHVRRCGTLLADEQRKFLRFTVAVHGVRIHWRDTRSASGAVKHLPCDARHNVGRDVHKTYRAQMVLHRRRFWATTQNLRSSFGHCSCTGSLPQGCHNHEPEYYRCATQPCLRTWRQRDRVAGSGASCPLQSNQANSTWRRLHLPAEVSQDSAHGGGEAGRRVKCRGQGSAWHLEAKDVETCQPRIVERRQRYYRHWRHCYQIFGSTAGATPLGDSGQPRKLELSNNTWYTSISVFLHF